jgi:hypothetical protein
MAVAYVTTPSVISLTLSLPCNARFDRVPPGAKNTAALSPAGKSVDAIVFTAKRPIPTAVTPGPVSTHCIAPPAGTSPDWKKKGVSPNNGAWFVGYAPPHAL